MLKINKNELAGTIKRILVFAAILLAAAIVVSAVENKKGSTSNQVSVDIDPLPSGNSLITEKDVLLTIERSFGYNLEGMPIVGLNVERIERVLESDPFILDAEVYIDAQNDIHISLVQREPILRIIDKNGLNYYLDKDGKKMPLSKHFSARVLTATGNIPPYSLDFEKKKKRNMLYHIYELSKTLLTDRFLKAQIEQIHVNSRSEIILVPMVGNQTILLGTYKHIDDKLKRLKIFYKEGIPYTGWHKHKTINLKYKNQVVCKKR